AIEPFQGKKKSLEENIYLEYGNSGGEKSTEFEKATTNLLKELGFSESLWIGSKKSQKNWRGNFPDVFIKRDDSMNCGLADTKATSIFSLGHADMLKMKETYFYTHKEIDSSSVLRYFLYIAGGFKGNINLSVDQLSKQTQIPVTAMDAKTMLLLKKLKEKGWEAKDIENDIFMSGGFISADAIESLQNKTTSKERN
ncbi:MAG: restriction endonuclease FokI C-terminal domain-containing protein, partial [Ignavibacteria bacterium]|nr:restriction endonuclease FokI C-terminal domain-containing protein [Ignavibacteria bacterium]